ncbi:response regulator transcription factor [Kineosporia mesophila]
MRTKVMIVDDQAMVRSAFSAVISAEPDLEVVGTAEDGLQAVERAGTLNPDVILMDVRMPHLNGIEATRRILARPGPHPAKVLILTTFDLDDYVYEALRAGAGGFLLKDARRADLVQAVRVVAAGEGLLAPTVTRRLIAHFAGRTAPDQRLSGLTPRETEVLKLIASGLSNAEIAAHLVVAEHTVKTHVSRILDKLGLRDRTQAVVLAYESGLVEVGRPYLER